MRQEDIKTFRDLQKEVISVGLCGKCGGCVSFCSAGTLNALQMGGGQGSDDDLPRFADEEKCLECGICYMICPSTTELDAEVEKRSGWRPPIGVYETIRSARATDETVRQVATDGGVVTALLLYMLDNHLIDGAIVSRKTSILSREPMIATTREELIAAAGSHFGGSSHLEELGEHYTTYSPTLSAVKALTGDPRSLPDEASGDELNRGDRRSHGNLQRVAMVGTPCQVRTVRKMQALGILPAHIVTFIIGLFCIENFAFDEPGRRKLEAWLQDAVGRPVHFEDIDKLNIKEDLIVSLSGYSSSAGGSVGTRTTVHVPLDELEEMARPACLACTDFANDYADLSVGGLGSPAGYTTVLIRTPAGNRILSEATGHGYIQTRSVKGWAEIRSEQAQMIDQVIALAQKKRMRGEARLAAARHQAGRQQTGVSA
jgi:coenzyme F420 hydrogenase subunit beta